MAGQGDTVVIPVSMTAEDQALIRRAAAIGLQLPEDFMLAAALAAADEVLSKSD